ncbi:hypothetical protein SCACP_34150 [Sporomusa carbonis]
MLLQPIRQRYIVGVIPGMGDYVNSYDFEGFSQLHGRVRKAQENWAFLTSYAVNSKKVCLDCLRTEENVWIY